MRDCIVKVHCRLCMVNVFITRSRVIQKVVNSFLTRYYRAYLWQGNFSHLERGNTIMTNVLTLAPRNLVPDISVNSGGLRVRVRKNLQDRTGQKSKRWIFIENESLCTNVLNTDAWHLYRVAGEGEREREGQPGRYVWSRTIVNMSADNNR